MENGNYETEYLHHLILEPQSALDAGNVEEFFSQVWATKYGRGFKKHVGDTPKNRAVILKAYETVYGGAVIFSQLVLLLQQLMLTHNPNFEYPYEPVVVPEPVDDRPRDATGRPMSERAQRWAKWEQVCADPKTSMKVIESWKRSDADFRDFYSTMYSKQVAQQVVGDAVVNLNVKSATTAKKIAPDVLAYAQRYRTAASETLRLEMNAGHVGAAAAAESTRLFLAAMECGLI
jgi:hypothetical protein